jgi:hypothetical protein
VEPLEPKKLLNWKEDEQDNSELKVDKYLKRYAIRAFS